MQIELSIALGEGGLVPMQDCYDQKYLDQDYLIQYNLVLGYLFWYYIVWDYLFWEKFMAPMTVSWLSWPNLSAKHCVCQMSAGQMVFD